jgi:hypothetical protein
MFQYLSPILFILSCGPTTISEESKPSGLVRASQAWNKKSLRVCWEQDVRDRMFQGVSSKLMVQATVTREYGKVGFDFYGWEDCAEDEEIRISVSDRRPRSRVVGSGLENVKDGIRLNFTYGRWPMLTRKCNQTGGSAWACYCKKSAHYKKCLDSYALHEFGHALGLDHEANHKDSTCNDTTRRNSGTVELGDYDKNSIMNYCHNRKQVLGLFRADTISSGDIETLLQYYKRLIN